MTLTTTPREGFVPTPLTEEDVIKLAQLKGVSKFLYETEYYRRLGYFHKKMNNLFRSDALTKGFFGGNRSAKTGSSARMLAMYASDDYWYYDIEVNQFDDSDPVYHAPIGSLPVVRREIGGNRKIWIVSKTTGQQVEAAQKWVMSYFEDSEIENVTWRDKGKGIMDGFTVKGTGTRVTYKSQDQGRETLQGAGLDVVWGDEEMARNIFSELFIRQDGGKDLNFWLSLTPLSGKTWIYYDIYKSTDKDVYIDNVSWRDNPWLTTKQKERMRSKYSKQELAAREMGMFIDSSIGVCPWYTAEKHLIDVDDIPLEACSIYATADFGWAPDPSVILLIGVDVKQNLYVFDAIKATELQGHELARLLKEKLGGRRLVACYADSANPDRINEFNRAGIPTMGVNKNLYKDANSKFTAGTWDRLMANSLAYYGEIQEGTGEPKLFISKEIKEYDHEKEREIYWLGEQLESLQFKTKRGKLGEEITDQWNDHRMFGHHFDGLYALAYFCVMFRKIETTLSTKPVIRTRVKKRGYYTR
jgi:phage terminase large subunit-like protein